MSSRLLSLGVNKTPFATNVLRFAEHDAVRFARTFTSNRGVVREEDASMLLGRKAHIKAVREALDMFVLFPPECFIFGWSGHGGDAGIALADEILGYDELGSYLNAIDAHAKVAVLATCHAGAAERMFETRIAGLEGLETAHSEALLAACPGLRLFMAVGPNDLAFDDSTVKGGRFMHGFFRALACAPGVYDSHGYPWIQDHSIVPLMRSIIARRWPDEALPRFVGPTGDCGAVPLLLSQAEHPVGSAFVSRIEPADGVAVRVSVDAYDRRFVCTHVQATALAAYDGDVIATRCLPYEPANAMSSVALRFGIDSDLLSNPGTAAWLRSGRPVRIVWHVGVRDDHGHLLHERCVVHQHWLRSRVA